MLQLRIHMLQIKIPHATTKTRSDQINKYFKTLKKKKTGLPWWLSGKESAYQCKRHVFSSLPGKIPHAVEQLSPRAATMDSVF